MIFDWRGLINNPTFILWLEVILIVTIGVVVIKFIENFVIRMYRKGQEKRGEYVNLKKEKNLSVMIKYVLWLIVLSIILRLIKPDTVNTIVKAITNYIPKIVSLLLILIFGFMIIHVIIIGLRKLLKTMGLFEMITELKDEVIEWILIIIRVILYIVLLFLVIEIYNVKVDFISYLIFFLISVSVILIFAFVFYGFKDIFRNIVYGFYIKANSQYKEGKNIRVIVKDKIVEGEIQRIGSYDTRIKLKGYKVMRIPNEMMVQNITYFDDIKVNIESLKDILKHFVEQKRSYCGPATLSMILSFLDIKISQEEIGKMVGTTVGYGTHPTELINAAEKITNGKLIGVWIPHDKISDLKKEMIAWLNQEGFVILDFKKNYVFPDAKTAHYSLCVSVIGDDLVLIDPNALQGGVYLTDYRNIFRGMDTYSKVIKGKRGYIVFGYSGTVAYDRIKEGMIYLKSSFYEKITKKLKDKLDKIDKEIENMNEIMPKNIKRKLKNKVSRVWKP